MTGYLLQIRLQHWCKYFVTAGLINFENLWQSSEFVKYVKYADIEVYGGLDWFFGTPMQVCTNYIITIKIKHNLIV